MTFDPYAPPALPVEGQEQDCASCLHFDNVGIMSTHEPGTCQTCGTLHYFWRSIGGRVVCAGCAPAVEREWAEQVAA